jgi:hypothetical protein
MIIQDFTNDYKQASARDIPKFKLNRKGETATIAIPDSIHLGMFHQVSIPGDKSRSGKYKCLGDYYVIFGDRSKGIPAKGADSDKCPFCARGVKLAFNAPGVGNCQLIYGTNIIRYITNAQGQVFQPLQADILPWVLNTQKYARLVTIRETHGDPQHGLKKRDLFVTSENPDFDSVTIDPMDRCLWLQNGQETMNRIWAAFNQNKIVDFEQLFYRGIVPYQGAQDLVSAAYGVSQGYVSGPPTNTDIQGLLDGPPTSSVPPSHPAGLTELFASIPGVEPVPQAIPAPQHAPSPIPPPPPPPQQSAKEVKPVTEMTANFDDLLNAPNGL